MSKMVEKMCEQMQEDREQKCKPVVWLAGDVWVSAR